MFVTVNILRTFQFPNWVSKKINSVRWYFNTIIIIILQQYFLSWPQYQQLWSRTLCGISAIFFSEVAQTFNNCHEKLSTVIITSNAVGFNFWLIKGSVKQRGCQFNFYINLLMILYYTLPVQYTVMYYTTVQMIRYS